MTSPDDHPDAGRQPDSGPAPRKGPTLTQSLTIAASSALVAAFGCAGYVTGVSGTFYGRDAVATTGAIAFGIGLLTFLCGCLLALVVVARGVFSTWVTKGRSGGQPPSSSSSSQGDS